MKVIAPGAIEDPVQGESRGDDVKQQPTFVVGHEIFISFKNPSENCYVQMVLCCKLKRIFKKFFLIFSIRIL